MQKPRLSREILIPAIIAVIGLAGLVVLQFSRSDSKKRAALMPVQAAQNEVKAAVDTLQKIPTGKLVVFQDTLEHNRPIDIKLTSFSQGATYEVDLGDGTRAVFNNGLIQHAYKKSGRVKIVLWAKYEGRAAAIDSVTKVVANAVKKDRQLPIIDL